jgi:hypothetical protein
MGESIMTTCMGLLEKTKDNIKAQKDLANLCNRPILELSETSHVVDEVNRAQKSCGG